MSARTPRRDHQDRRLREVGAGRRTTPASRPATPLILLDDSDYRIALQQAEAQVATQQAAVARIGQQIAAGEAQVTQARGELASAKAAADNAQAEFDRATRSPASQFGTQQAVDAARTAMLQADAGSRLRPKPASPRREANVAVLAAQKVEAERVLDQYRLARDQAQLDLDHTVVRAPFDGVVGNGAAEPGEYVQPGQRLMALVPLQDVYIDANFKETQLADLKPGQTVEDLRRRLSRPRYRGDGGERRPGLGLGLQPAAARQRHRQLHQGRAARSGPHPRCPASVAAEGLIRPGMSVVVAVDTRTGPTAVAAR